MLGFVPEYTVHDAIVSGVYYMHDTIVSGVTVHDTIVQEIVSVY